MFSFGERIGVGMTPLLSTFCALAYQAAYHSWLFLPQSFTGPV